MRQQDVGFSEEEWDDEEDEWTRAHREKEAAARQAAMQAQEQRISVQRRAQANVRFGPLHINRPDQFCRCSNSQRDIRPEAADDFCRRCFRIARPRTAVRHDR